MTTVRTRHLRPEDLRGLRWRGYLRESTQGQADRGTPLDRQRVDIERAAIELGMVPAEPLWYERVGSGESRDVPELQRALADAQAKQYDVLVVFHSSRLAREAVEAGLLKRRFTEAGTILYFVSQRLISGTYQGALAEGVGAVIDSYENETRRMWVAGGLRQRQASGRWVGIIPVGYRKRLVDFPDGTRGWDGALDLDPTFAPVIRRIYDEAAAGSGARKIARGLNEDGLRTNNGRLWAYGTVHDILTNRVYVGRMLRYRRTVATAYYGIDSPDGRADLGEHVPALVDETLWGQVQESLSERRMPAGKSTGRTYPLSRVLRCAGCGYRMTGATNTALVRYYRCAGRYRFHVCDAPAIRADIAEEAFAGWIGSYQLPDDWRTAVARTSLDRMKVDERDRRKGAEDRLKRLRDLYSWGDIGEEEYRRDTSEIRASMVVVRPGLAGLESVADVLRDLGPAWRSASPEAQAAIPPLMLKSASVADGAVSEWVVRAELRPLLELCVPTGANAWSCPLRYSA